MRCCIGLLLLLLANGASAEETARVYLEAFQLGSPARRVEGWRELDPARAVAGCQALGFDCSDDPDPSRAATRFLKPSLVSGPYRGTAKILRRRGNSFYAAFDTPPGFRLCKAGIDRVGGSIDRGAVFAGSIQRAGGDRLGVYAALPADGSGAIAFRLLVVMVPEARFAAEPCWPDGTLLFLCSGSTRCQVSRAFPEADLR